MFLLFGILTQPCMFKIASDGLITPDESTVPVDAEQVKNHAQCRQGGQAARAEAHNGGGE
jgi:hypothetical protein